MSGPRPRASDPAPPADVAVSIVNHNNRRLLLDCLSSLSDDPGRRASVEIVVLDNASEDGSVAAVRERFPEVRVIERRQRHGFGANHNEVVRSTSSRYVYILNDDTVTEPGSLDRMVGYLDAHPRVGAVGPRIVDPVGRQQASAWRLWSLPVALAWAASAGQAGWVLSNGDRPRRVGMTSGSAFMVRREAFERVGLFDEDLFMYSEEPDLGERLRRMGYEWHYLPDVTTVHLGQQSTQVQERQINERWRSFALYLRKHHSAPAARSIVLLRAAGYALAAVVSLLLRVLPPRMRPAAADYEPARLWHHARNGFRGVSGPGTRESAEDWNRGRG